jgi:hypothetical protein
MLIKNARLLFQASPGFVHIIESFEFARSKMEEADEEEIEVSKGDTSQKRTEDRISPTRFPVKKN